MTTIKRISFAFAFALIAVGAGKCSKYTVKPDQAMAAEVAGAYTALAEGCGQQLNMGMLYCEYVEGDATDKRIYMVGPESHCSKDKKEPCVFFKIYSGISGELILGGSIPRGKTRKAVLWSDLIGRDHFEPGDRQNFLFLHEVKWADPEGRIHSSFSRGEIALRVYREGYESLRHAVSDPNFVWSWSENGITVKATTGLRVYVEKAGQ